VRLVADMDGLEVDDWTSSGKSWQHDGLASRSAQEERSLRMIKARNQDDHELSLSTYTQEQHDENHGGRS
jgi:hypothetical protein